MLLRTPIRRQLPRICICKPWRLLADHALFSPDVYFQIHLRYGFPRPKFTYCQGMNPILRPMNATYLHRVLIKFPSHEWEAAFIFLY